MQIILASADTSLSNTLRAHVRRLDKAAAALLDHGLDIQPVGRISDMEDAIRTSTALRLILLDAKLYGMDGIASIKHLISNQKHVVLAVMGGKASMAEMQAMLGQGAMGYIPSNFSAQAFFAALVLMLDGHRFLPVVKAVATGEGRATLMALTRREKDVLLSLLRGQADKEIAAKHGIAIVTVKHHLKSLRIKLGANNRTHALARAVALGLTDSLIDEEAEGRL